MPHMALGVMMEVAKWDFHSLDIPRIRLPTGISQVDDQTNELSNLLLRTWSKRSGPYKLLCSRGLSGIPVLLRCWHQRGWGCSPSIHVGMTKGLRHCPSCSSLAKNSGEGASNTWDLSGAKRVLAGYLVRIYNWDTLMPDASMMRKTAFCNSFWGCRKPERPSSPEPSMMTRKVELDGEQDVGGRSPYGETLPAKDQESAGSYRTKGGCIIHWMGGWLKVLLVK